MAVNRGKQFENVVRTAFKTVTNVSIDRLHDQTTGYAGSSNICDFIVYKKPYEYYIECKAVHGNTLSINSNKPDHRYGVITNKQWEGLLEKSEIEGVIAGVIVWFIDHDVTRFITIQQLVEAKKLGCKSIRYDDKYMMISGKKKRVLFDYDMLEFFRRIEESRYVNV